MSTYEARLKRMTEAAALKEPDRVPYAPVLQCYPVLHAGYSMKDALYDHEKGAEGFLRFAKEYEPDCMFGQTWVYLGRGPILELQDPHTVTWAGAPGTAISDDSIHQFLEFPILKDEDIDLFRRDRGGWLLEKGLPASFGVMEPFAKLGLSRMNPGMDMSPFAHAISTPEMRRAIETCWKISDLRKENDRRDQALTARLEEAGFPVLHQGFAAVPFDTYSDSYRGTIESLSDLYLNEELVEEFRSNAMEGMLQMIRGQGKAIKGKWVFMALHKGMDGFMSDEQYRKYYWSDLQRIIEEIIDAGMTPYIYTEGKYDSRLECLKEVPKGKVVYHFESCDMAEAKRVLGDVACISGGFPAYLLEWGTVQQVEDECKRLIDICAPGGGYIFETNYGFDNAKPENVEAMTRTVKEYGKH